MKRIKLTIRSLPFGTEHDEFYAREVFDPDEWPRCGGPLTFGRKGRDGQFNETNVDDPHLWALALIAWFNLTQPDIRKNEARVLVLCEEVS
jgi:hypothetical protein